MSGWWAQCVTVAYEKERGLRELYGSRDGKSFKGSVSKVFPVPVSRLYRALADEKSRAKLLGAGARAGAESRVVVRRATANKSLRITWSRDGSDVEMNFYAKGAAKSSVQIQHAKLKSAAQVLRMKKYWKGVLEKLVAQLDRA